MIADWRRQNYRLRPCFPATARRPPLLTVDPALEEAHKRLPLRILSYCVLPNHWHFVVWPERGKDDQVSDFFRWLTLTHTQRWHAHYGTSGTGHLYQGRFKSFPVEADEHLATVIRYVERNALRAGLVERAEEWQWSSLWRRQQSDEALSAWLSEWPIPRSSQWLRWVNQPQSEAERAAVQRSVRRGCPFGSKEWSERRIEQLGLKHTVRPQGCPRKAVN